MTLEQMRSIDITTVDRNTLVDIMTVRTDTTLPDIQRKLNFIKQIKNPYCFLVGDTVVKISFDEKGPPITDSLENIFIKA